MEKRLLGIPIAALILFIIGAVYYANNEISQPGIAYTGPGYYNGNFHTHTTASDGKQSYYEVISEAKELGFSFIVITDHNTQSFATMVLCPREKRLLCIPGEEIGTKEGHLIGIGLSEVIEKGLSAKRSVELVHSEAGLAIPAHPETDLGMTKKVIETLPVDAVECNIHSVGDKGICNSFSGYPRVYDSDSHNYDDMKNIASRCYLADLSFDSIKEAVRAGNCTMIKPGEAI